MTDIYEKVVVALIGAGIGWAGTSLTVVGRVDAMEKVQGRIEAQIDRMDTRIKLLLNRLDPHNDYSDPAPKR